MAAESFPRGPVFGGEPELIGDVTTDDRFREATACREALDEAGLRAVLAGPPFAGGRGGGGPRVINTTRGRYTPGPPPACRPRGRPHRPPAGKVVALRPLRP